MMHNINSGLSVGIRSFIHENTDFNELKTFHYLRPSLEGITELQIINSFKRSQKLGSCSVKYRTTKAC